MSTFYVQNFGCRATQADGAAIEQQFLDLGLQRAPDAAAAHWVILNTCAVTAQAEQDARAAIRRVRRGNESCKIVITGCYAQRAPAEVAALRGVSHIVGNSEKHALAELVLGRKCQDNSSLSGSFFPLASLQTGRAAEPSSEAVEIFVSDIFAHTRLLAAPVFDSGGARTRPNLKIQDGCSNRCSFCIIPSVRGRSRSLAYPDVLREINQLVGAGYREVVISGINLGRWGRDLAPGRQESGSTRKDQPAATDLAKLIRAILEHTSLEKLRVSSVEPMDWTDALVRLMAESPRIAKHVHVPLQSASDSILRAMRRRYRPWHYREKILNIRAAMPTAAIGADVMVGFPGESEADFDETRAMIEELPLTYLHVFTFSARPGTAAATLGNPLPAEVAGERSRILRDLGTRKKLVFMRSFIGRQLQAITLAARAEQSGGNWTEALSDNYLKVRLEGRQEANRWVEVSIGAVRNGYLSGQPVRP
ncbi:MAG: tRNA (N(6)-L-threonylcarbamoyladenosine(37)-C(2))-methylthiotransferase MtaB [Acidobacteria bacterium]|nr:tRNA (N(6)-L-threonylcarbamoyladenosine(37)-C(2))-methylthiotransferase MtaB [Acidobacteriota bacterium]MBV9623086.1 tRNA (N(6)-L-threonylcarbamoyladenosine(37)-C(2))-methylthiotransferase MtaB [Acidobacteriota bacterium]